MYQFDECELMNNKKLGMDMNKEVIADMENRIKLIFLIL